MLAGGLCKFAASDENLIEAPKEVVLECLGETWTCRQHGRGYRAESDVSKTMVDVENLAQSSLGIISRFDVEEYCCENGVVVSLTTSDFS